MPRPIPVPVRLAMFRLWQQGRAPAQIAEALDLSPISVRRLIRRFRGRGSDGIAPDYRPPRTASPSDSDFAMAAIRLRREHPTWGAGLIRVQLLENPSLGPAPSVRTLQRWFGQADLVTAPAGRRPRADPSRAVVPHQTWQMDAKELIKLRSNEQVSWLRLVDECSGAALWTAVFPPRAVEARPRRGRPRPAAIRVQPLGPAGGAPRGQRAALGLSR
jgi:Helix-turn-helix domain